MFAIYTFNREYQVCYEVCSTQKGTSETIQNVYVRVGQKKNLYLFIWYSEKLQNRFLDGSKNISPSMSSYFKKKVFALQLFISFLLSDR